MSLLTRSKVVADPATLQQMVNTLLKSEAGQAAQREVIEATNARRQTLIDERDRLLAEHDREAPALRAAFERAQAAERAAFEAWQQTAPAVRETEYALSQLQTRTLTRVGTIETDLDRGAPEVLETARITLQTWLDRTHAARTKVDATGRFIERWWVPFSPFPQRESITEGLDRRTAALEAALKRVAAMRFEARVNIEEDLERLLATIPSLHSIGLPNEPQDALVLPATHTIT